MKRTISVLLLIFILLTLAACAKAEPENPYRLIQQSAVKYHPEECDIFTHTYSYDDQGFLTQWEDGQGSVTEVLKDDYGNTVQTTLRTADGHETTHRFALTLDDQHRILRSENWLDGELTSIQEYSYDSSGNEVQYTIQRFGPGENLSATYDHEYDRSGSLIRSQTRRKDGYEGYTEYQYRDGKCLSKVFRNQDGTVALRRDYSYDPSGLVETMIEYDGDSAPMGKSVSTYDVYGNILRFEVHHYLEDQTEPVLAQVITYTYEEIPQ